MWIIFERKLLVPSDKNTQILLLSAIYFPMLHNIQYNPPNSTSNLTWLTFYSRTQVFGAYCSSRWYERNLKDDKGNRQGKKKKVQILFICQLQANLSMSFSFSYTAYFGTGESFLFSLYPERAKYPWVGIDSDKNVDHSAELFMAADNKMLTIGGG